MSEGRFFAPDPPALNGPTMPMDLSKFAVHTYTNKPWSITECIEGYARRGFGGISIWRETIAGADLAAVRRHLAAAGLEGISLVRGGFFTGATREERDRALVENRSAIREAEALGLPSVVLVCGATPAQSPLENRKQILEGIAAIADEARQSGVRLLVEPLHPMYAGNRSAIASLRDANDLCGELNHEAVGIALDVFHVWWEMDLAEQVARAAQGGWLDAYHVCDFKPDMADLLLDRGLPGEGCAALREIDQLVLDAGFSGFREVEIFSSKWWARDQNEFLDAIVDSCQALYGDEPSS